MFKPVETLYNTNQWGLNNLGRNSATQGTVNRIGLINIGNPT